MTDAQKMKIKKMLETLDDDITNIEDTCDSLRYFIRNINMFVNNLQEDNIEWVEFRDFDDINKYKCTYCGCVWKYPYNYCPTCGISHKEED